MSYYDSQPWAAAQARQPSWDQQIPPQRTGDSPSPALEAAPAFLTQLEEVERAIDNLGKSGKFYPGGPGGYGASARRETFPAPGRGYSEMGIRAGGPPRGQPINEFDGARPGSTVGLQGYYASQRFQPPQNDQDQALHAKRRLAAQRERELRNYHQEQQYSRNTPSIAAERPLSPSSLNDEERRDLLARQHRALYGQDASMYPSEVASQRPPQDVRGSISGAVRGPSPLSFDSFGLQKSQSSVEPMVQMPLRDQGVAVPERRTSISPPSAGRSTFGAGDSNSPPLPTSAVSPVTSPSIGSGKMPSMASQGGMAPIGRRPPQTVSSGVMLSTSPKERSTSASSNSGLSEKTPAITGWGSSSGVWGTNKNSLGVQASVWG